MPDPAAKQAPRLALPDGKRVRAFRAVEAILREDDALKRVVKTWVSWDGSPGDTARPTLDMMPMIRLNPRIEPSESFSNGQRIGSIGLAVEVMAPGLHANDIVNLWDAVEDALVDMKPFRATTVGCFLRQEVGASRYTVPEPGFAARETREAGSHKFLTAEGVVVVTFLRNA